MRAPTTAPNITYPCVKGDVGITGDVNTGRNDYCANCGKEITEQEIYKMNWKESKLMPTGRYRWIHFNSLHGLACIRAVPKRCKERISNA